MLIVANLPSKRIAVSSLHRNQSGGSKIANLSAFTGAGAHGIDRKQRLPHPFRR